MNTISKMSDINFESEDCLYCESQCFEHDGAVYEDLRNANDDDAVEFRVIFSEDDYDYVAEQYSEDFKEELRKARRDQRK